MPKAFCSSCGEHPALYAGNRTGTLPTVKVFWAPSARLMARWPEGSRLTISEVTGHYYNQNIDKIVAHRSCLLGLWGTWLNRAS